MNASTFVALVAAIAVTAYGSPLAKDEQLQPLELLGDLHMVKVEKIIYTVADKTTSDLTLCINETVPYQDATVVIIDGNTQKDIPGTETAEDNKCYKFTDITFPKDNENVTYMLKIHKANVPYGPLGYLEYTFHDVPKISTFDCYGQEYSRITYQSSGSDLSGQMCLKDQDSICYLSGNFNISGAGNNSICLPTKNNAFKDNNDMAFCQPGSINKFEMGTHFSQYLNYDGFYAFSDDGKSASASEAILLSNGKFVGVTAQTNNQVVIENFAPSTTSYHVCSIQLDKAGGIMKGAYQSDVQDLNVHGMNFVGDFYSVNWANDNAKNTYSLKGASSADNVDCEKVGKGNPCYARTSCSGKTLIDLQYTGGVVNIIEVPQDKLTEQ